MLIKNSKQAAVKELTLDDKDNLRQCYLYLMSKTEYLKWFTDVTLVHISCD